MTGLPRIKLIGIGSEHGDDCVGWRVIERIEHLGLPGVECFKAQVPIQAVDQLSDADSLHVVDAVKGSNRSSVTRLSYSDPRDQPLVSQQEVRGTHGIGILEAIRLAEVLGRTVGPVTLWLVAGEQFEPMSGPSRTAEGSIERCVQKLLLEIRGGLPAVER